MLARNLSLLPLILRNDLHELVKFVALEKRSGKGLFGLMNLVWSLGNCPLPLWFGEGLTKKMIRGALCPLLSQEEVGS